MTSLSMCMTSLSLYMTSHPMMPQALCNCADELKNDQVQKVRAERGNGSFGEGEGEGESEGESEGEGGMGR